MSKLEYKLYSELEGTRGAVNALLFSENGRDDEKVRVWNTENLQCERTLHSDRWGQVTTLAWIHIDTPIDDKCTMLFVGGGRGCASFRAIPGPYNLWTWKESKTFSIFDFNDSVETQAYDRLNSRLAVSSHSGNVKLYSVDKMSLKPVWSIRMGQAIPRVLLFYGATHDQLLLLGLETGEMCCREVESSVVIWEKTMNGAVGNAAISADQTVLIVNNLTTTNFDIYELPSNFPTKSLTFTSTRRYAKQCVFSEGSQVAICGSTIDKAYIVDVSTTECLQTLTMGLEADMMQTVAATGNTSRVALVAVGSSSGGIYVWKRESADNETTIIPTPRDTSISLAYERVVSPVNTQVMVLVLVLTYGNWSPHFWRFFNNFSSTLLLMLKDFGLFA